MKTASDQKPGAREIERALTLPTPDDARRPHSPVSLRTASDRLIPGFLCRGAALPMSFSSFSYFSSLGSLLSMSEKPSTLCPPTLCHQSTADHDQPSAVKIRTLPVASDHFRTPTDAYDTSRRQRWPAFDHAPPAGPATRRAARSLRPRPPRRNRGCW